MRHHRFRELESNAFRFDRGLLSLIVDQLHPSDGMNVGATLGDGHSRLGGSIRNQSGIRMLPACEALQEEQFWIVDFLEGTFDYGT